MLLTQRPATMAFAPDAFVFPGGAVDPTDADAGLATRSSITPEEAARRLGGDLPPADALAIHVAAIRELWEESGVLLADGAESVPPTVRPAVLAGDKTLIEVADAHDLRLRTDAIAPLSRWVTPPPMPRRFDARFFATLLPAHARPTFLPSEVVDHRWQRPADALAEVADGRMTMWVPTSATLQQLEHVVSFEQIATRLAPTALGEIVVERLTDEIVRVALPAGGGVPGQPVNAYLVGRRRLVLVDPGDPTGPGLERILAEAEAIGARIVAIALTHVDPDHAGGAEGLALQLGVPILVGPGGGGPLPYAVDELADGQVVDGGDVPLHTIRTPGPRPDHLAYVVGDGAALITGDLDGVRGARSVPGPTDDAAWAVSLDRADALGIDRRLPGHP